MSSLKSIAALSALSLAAASAVADEPAPPKVFYRNV